MSPVRTVTHVPGCSRSCRVCRCSSSIWTAAPTGSTRSPAICAGSACRSSAFPRPMPGCCRAEGAAASICARRRPGVRGFRSSGVPACQEMSCFVMFGPFRPGLPIRQTGPYTMFFSHSNRLSGARQNAGPAAAALLLKVAGPGGNRPPKKRFCSYNVLMRLSSSLLRRLRPGSGLGIPLRTRQRRARREWVRYSESPEGAGGERPAGPGYDARRPVAEAAVRQAASSRSSGRR